MREPPHHGAYLFCLDRSPQRIITDGVLSRPFLYLCKLTISHFPTELQTAPYHCLNLDHSQTRHAVIGVATPWLLYPPCPLV